MQRSKPFLILAHTRTGGTFLCHCLDSHLWIYCSRGEPLYKHSHVKKLASVQQKLNVLLKQEGYIACGAKITYGQINYKVWEYIKKNKVRVIHHIRDNILKSSTSNIMRRLRKSNVTNYPTHITKEHKNIVPVTIDIPDLMLRLQYHKKTRDKVREKLKKLGIKHLETSYYSQTGGLDVQYMDEMEAKRICKFLGVKYRVLECPLKKINKFHYSKLINNWEAVEKAVKNSEYSYCLRESCV